MKNVSGIIFQCFTKLHPQTFWISACSLICIVAMWFFFTFVFCKCYLITGFNNPSERGKRSGCWRRPLNGMINCKTFPTSLHRPLTGKRSSDQGFPLSFLSVWSWYSSPLWRSGRNPSLLPSPHRSSSSLRRAGSDLSPASSWSRLNLPVTAWPPCESSPHLWTTRLPRDRTAHRYLWKQLHPLCQRGWRRWRGRRSPPAWHGSCQIRLR